MGYGIRNRFQMESCKIAEFFNILYKYILDNNINMLYNMIKQEKEGS